MLKTYNDARRTIPNGITENLPSSPRSVDDIELGQSMFVFSAVDGKEVYNELQRTCTAIVSLIKPFVWWRSGSGHSHGLFKAGVKRRTSHEPNGMQMRKTPCSPSLTFDSAHVKYGAWPGPKFPNISVLSPHIRNALMTDILRRIPLKFRSVSAKVILNI